MMLLRPDTDPERADHTDGSEPRAARSTRFARLVRDVEACSACSRVAHCHALGAANGSIDAHILFVAEAPGRLGAAITRVPLSGDDAGRRFDAFLALAGIERSDAFITNAVLCNPLDARGRNRPPLAGERNRCHAFLARTIEVVPAPIVVALGRVALESLRRIAAHDADLPRDAARARPWHGRTLVPLFHPARRSTLHRPQASQEEDWRTLGALCSTRSSSYHDGT
jgi:uracil-DNA glycosylase family 4